MYYVYLLYSSTNKKYYIGTTPDVEKRLKLHNGGKNLATKSGIPWQLLYYEAYINENDAYRRERSLKHYGQGLRRLKERITLE